MPWAPEPDSPAGMLLEHHEKLSTDCRRTLRQRAALEAGVHPLIGGPVRTDGSTCGNCANRIVHRYWKKSFSKCRIRGGGSAATDVRNKWPGCRYWVGK